MITLSDELEARFKAFRDRVPDVIEVRKPRKKKIKPQDMASVETTSSKPVSKSVIRRKT
jgi:hypothetical protein